MSRFFSPSSKLEFVNSKRGLFYCLFSHVFSGSVSRHLFSFFNRSKSTSTPTQTKKPPPSIRKHSCTFVLEPSANLCSNVVLNCPHKRKRRALFDLQFATPHPSLRCPHSSQQEGHKRKAGGCEEVRERAGQEGCGVRFFANIF